MDLCDGMEGSVVVVSKALLFTKALLLEDGAKPSEPVKSNSEGRIERRRIVVDGVVVL